MTTSVKDDRASFEAWANDHFKYVNLAIDPTHPEHYAYRPVAFAWQAWQAALRSQGKVEVWRPIDTAPTDRTMLLLADKSGSVQIGFWNGSAWDDGDFHDNMGPMTHWMPLPPVPTNYLTAIIGEGD